MSRKLSRRSFVSDLAAGTTLGSAAPLEAARHPVKTTARPGGPEPFRYPRVFSARQLHRIAFPLGGIGTGSVSLGGRGQLRDWEIFNRPDKGISQRPPQYAFASIYAQTGRNDPVVRVLEARYMPPYDEEVGRAPLYANVPGLPRLASARFTGEFPLARVQFDDPELPVKVALEAFTPFIPLDADASGLPIAVLRYRVRNTGAARARVSISCALDNPIGEKGKRIGFRSAPRLHGLFFENPALDPGDPMSGSMALCVLPTGPGNVTYLRGWPPAKWFGSPQLYWDDFSSDGELGPETPERGTVGCLCLAKEITPDAEVTFTFLLSWHFPNRTPARCGWEAAKGEENTVIGNYYCTLFHDAWDVAEFAATHLPDLERRTRRFISAIRQSTLPAAVRDAAVSNLSTLVTNTCFRTADGAFYGFEGSDNVSGCCFGSCTHVWNYEVTTAFLFPVLSRSMREASFGCRMHENGLIDMRQVLPAGKGFDGRAAADGQMGQVMRLYLDWKLSGDMEWLRCLWPAAKKAMQFAWIRGGWDADRDGVMEGVQHNTYDVEFCGPNPLCQSWYLGALKAAAEMARAVNDHEAAADFERLFSRGSKWTDTYLFNGEFYRQQVRAAREVAEGLCHGRAVDPQNPTTFQVAEGCMTDQLVGQYMASVSGLGPILDTGNMHEAAGSVYRYNYKRDLYHHECVQRAMAFNDEAGLVICTYPPGKRPRVPLTYYAEVLPGFDYAAAVVMLYQGLISEGLEVFESSRRRYDGEKRNPWDEYDCGHHYARAMASWAAIPALSGFQYSGSTGRLVFLPLLQTNPFRCFWSTAQAWGVFSQKTSAHGYRAEVSVAEGTLACASLALPVPRARELTHFRARLGGQRVPCSIEEAQDGIVAVFHETVRVEAEHTLDIEGTS